MPPLSMKRSPAKLTSVFHKYRNAIDANTAGFGLVVLGFILLFPGLSHGFGLSRNPPSAVWVSASMEKSYMVQLSSFKSRSNAERFIASIKKKGYTPFLEKGKKGKGWYHVRVGPYPSRDAANQVVREIKQVEGVSAIVLVSMRMAEPGEASARIAAEEFEGKAIEKVSGDTGETTDVVVSRFLVWLKAWQDRDLDQYLAFYSKSFKSSQGTFKKWKKSRHRALSIKNKIVIVVSDVQMQEKKDMVKMSFIQDYKSETLSDVGRKTLIWRKEGGQWKIVRETWEPV